MRTARLLTVATTAALAASPLIVNPAAATAKGTIYYDATWTVDSSANSVTEFSAVAHGAASPVGGISGALTGLDDPTGVATSLSGRVFVTNAGDNTITEYEAGAHGDVAPIAVIGGTKTGLDAPSSITVIDDQVWVTNPATNVVEAFTANSHGNELPAATFAGAKTKLNHPVAVSVNGEFGDLDVLNTPTSGAATITSFDAENPGDESPDDVMSLAKYTPTALLSLGFGSDWIVDSAHNRLVNVGIGFSAKGLTTNALQEITGSRTGLNDPDAISQNALGRLVVSNAGTHSVLIFGGTANGNVAPLRSISGVGTAASQPTALTVYGTAPAEPTAVTAKRHGRKVTLHWDPPAVTGGGVIGYDIDVETGQDYGFGEAFSELSPLGGQQIQVDTTKTTAVKTIKPGKRYTFRVIAVNAFGQSNPSAGAHAAIPTKPGTPTGVAAFTYKTMLLAAWEPPSKDGGTAHLNYRVEYAAGCMPGASGCKYKSKHAGFEVAIIKGIKAHTKYHVRVVAHNKLGFSKPSKVVTSKKLPRQAEAALGAL
jgi:hypothetical protein